MTTSKSYFQTRPNHFWLVFFISLISLGLGSYASLRFGAIRYSHQEVITILAQPFLESQAQNIIIDSRFPRLIAACLVGAGLATSGLITQAVTQNPISDPGLLGINAGAGLALVLAYLLIKKPHYSFILLFCLIGASLAALFVFGLAYQKKASNHQIRLILAGAMMTTLFSAIGQVITITNHLSTTIIGWQSGGLVAVNWSMITFIAPFILFGLGSALFFSHQLNLLNLEKSLSQALGQNIRRTQLLLLAIVLLLSASSVALVGNLAFIGLLIPHLAKLVIRQHYQQLLPLTMLWGASFMVWIDLLCRMINSPYETSLNAVVSLISLPSFLILIRKEQNL
ncbi:iron ABC transporter permease [Streptococcus sp. sy018]|uniref:FecCD family ABC transporter permease n=1 Tax=Streptococcus sp. sy018 TaxID=2600147 RepID=UPI0011B5771B|nr:iron ABC transporter permease [Streptococcus sp. sy018]TWS94075.1 iron ABC transporter permease [Streptococcus sp. sy018]